MINGRVINLPNKTKSGAIINPSLDLYEIVATGFQSFVVFVKIYPSANLQGDLACGK